MLFVMLDVLTKITLKVLVATIDALEHEEEE